MAGPPHIQWRSSRLVSSLLRSATRKPRAKTSLPCPACRSFTSTPRLPSKQPADSPDFLSILDNPPTLVRTGNRHGPGLLILVLIPLTAFALGTWQVQRLDWKSKLIAKFEDRLVRPPLPLPLKIDPEAISEFDYRRVYATGKFRHDLEMLIGPRMYEGKEGFLVVTPLEREGEGTSVLVNRGWIPRKFKSQRSREGLGRGKGDGGEEALPRGRVGVEGLLREPWKKNMFTPENAPGKGEFYFPDVEQMAALTGSQAVWIEETMEADLMRSWDREAKGIPIGRPAEINLRNNHAQYIFTWYALAAATSVMLWMVIKKPPADISRRVRQNKEWS